jgi:hypothetical protein
VGMLQPIAFAIPSRVHPPCLILPDIHALSVEVKRGITSRRIQNEKIWDAQCQRTGNEMKISQQIEQSRGVE